MFISHKIDFWAFVHLEFTIKILKNPQKSRQSGKKLNGYDECVGMASRMLTLMEVRYHYCSTFIFYSFLLLSNYPLISKQWTKQSKKLSMVLCCVYLIWIHSELRQIPFCNKVIQDSCLLTEEPKLPRPRKVPVRSQSSSSTTPNTQR